MNREYILTLKTYYKVPHPKDDPKLVERRIQINRMIIGDLTDPWSRQELHLWLDQMMNDLGKAVSKLDDDPR